MILEVVKYGHPVLRQKGARIEKVTPEIKKLIADMFETMHTNHGIGLAAQQVGRALQLTVIDVREAKDRPSWLELDGEPADVNEFMPLVLINPELKPGGEPGQRRRRLPELPGNFRGNHPARNGGRESVEPKGQAG